MARKTEEKKNTDMVAEKVSKGRNRIGFELEIPAVKCDDKHCPFHGSLKLRGRVFVGEVIRSSSPKTVVVEWQRWFYLPKYERYEKRRTRVQAHNPNCVNVSVGEVVKIIETRPISKTKNFVVVGRIVRK